MTDTTTPLDPAVLQQQLDESLVEAAELRAELAEVTAERDEAKAKVTHALAALQA